MIGSQVGATFTKLFNKELGVDLDAKQMHYIVMKGLEMLGIALLGVLAAVLVGFLRRAFRPAWQSRCAAMCPQGGKLLQHGVR